MTFIPALKYRFLTNAYDTIIRFLMPELKIKQKVIDLANIQKHDSILDFGCGTGTLIYLMANQFPDSPIKGLDVDKEILALASQKQEKENPKIEFCAFNGKEIPFDDDYFNVIFSTWVFHHLTNRNKILVLKELKRVLKQDGIAVIADWGKASNYLMRALFFLVQVFDNFYTTSANINGRLPSLFKEVGFDVYESANYQNTLFGTFRYWTVKHSEIKIGT